MIRYIEPQLSGDVLIALRSSEGFGSHREFADTLPMSDTTLWRMETVRWGSSPSSWKGKMRRSDLVVLAGAGWVEEGDDWWEQFRTAFAWQHLVEKHGEEIYADHGGSLRLLTPISEEHVLALVEAMVTRELMRRARQSEVIGGTDSQALTDKVYAEIVFRLTTMGFILTEELDVSIIPDTERTRSLEDLLVSGGAEETPYTRTLLFAYEWIDGELSRLLDPGEGDGLEQK